MDPTPTGAEPSSVYAVFGVLTVTMVIVEQSLNVALAICDRAIFLEKGEVKFEGSAQDLIARDDLARAVFFGREGG